MKVAMPTGNTHGWGIAGTYLSAELAKLPPIDGVTLHSVAGHHFAPTFPEAWDRINIGYCFFESEIMAYHFIPEASRRWDHIVAGSSWCEYHLRIAGMDRTSTILQGIDPAVFSPAAARDEDGRFIVFSGGKFEFRKGHDLVIAAMRVFMQEHTDAWLACSWHNHWPMSIKTMEQSSLLNFRYQDLPCEELYLKLLEENGIPVDRVILYPVQDNRLMRQAYTGSDMGFFPNRCEGGNNMVMCEYMACARPVIASTLTGHMDVINSGNALCLTHNTPIISTHDGVATGVWFEPSVEEAVALLNQAYADRQALERLGVMAGKSIKGLSWSEAARKFHTLGQMLAASRPVEKIAIISSGATAERAAELFAEGHYDDAAKEYSELLKLAPLDPDLHNNMGTVLDRLERYAESVLHYEKALALRPGFVEARFNLANTLKRMGDKKGAIEQLEAVVSVSPSFVEAWQNLALCCLDSNDSEGAVKSLERVLEIDANCFKSWTDLGMILVDLKRYAYAIKCFDEVLQHEPDNAGVLNSKGIALQKLNDLETAESCYRKILLQDPENILALNNLGTVLRAKSLPEQSVQCFSRALEQKPDDGQLLFNRSLAYLLMGDFEHGWSDYEGRFTSAPPVQLRHQTVPRWRGEPLGGKRILVWCEQGYGDSIQFVRYARSLANMGAAVVLEAQDGAIAPLLALAHGVDQVLVRGGCVGNVDYQSPLLSLPRYLGNIPCPPYYLDIPHESVSFWGNQLGAAKRFNVGLAWAGRPSHENDYNRSIPAQYFQPLAACSDIQFISLQFSPAEGLLFEPPVLDITSRINNFADSAALIANLDLVISVDSAVAHLAGALGVPTWVLLPYNPDWRWLMEREDSPWYNSIRLFRQHEPASWQDVILSVSEKLNNFRRNKKMIKE